MKTKIYLAMLAASLLAVVGYSYAATGEKAATSCCSPGAACCPGPCCE